MHNAVEIDSGRGDDCCELNLYYPMYTPSTGSVAVDTGSGDDTFFLHGDFSMYGYEFNRGLLQVELDVRLNGGDDTLMGENGLYHEYYDVWLSTYGTVDAGKGEDSRADFSDDSGLLDILNFED
jgi:hypothetical protein